MRNLKLIAFDCQRKHINISICVVVIIMSVDQLHHDVLAGDPLIELHIPLDRAEILVAPEYRIAIHALQIECSLQPLDVRQINFKGNIYIVLLIQT